VILWINNSSIISNTVSVVRRETTNRAISLFVHVSIFHQQGSEFLLRQRWKEIGQVSALSPAGRYFSRYLRAVESPHINPAGSDHRQTYLACGRLGQGLWSSLTTSCQSLQRLHAIYIGLAATPSITTPWLSFMRTTESGSGLLRRYSFPQSLHAISHTATDSSVTRVANRIGFSFSCYSMEILISTLHELEW
jgi:hypothetical protein